MKVKLLSGNVILFIAGKLTMTDLKNLSESELHNFISEANQALREIQKTKRKEVTEEIQKLAASINCRAQLISLDQENNAAPQRRSKVPIKYRNPDNPQQTWKGRGQKPRWLREKLDQGHDITEFSV
ncbi:MAG: H-NS histone family protein [Methylococcales bacterium]|nr:H-NS histone family protein [Methylococcales bacterium]